MQLGKKRATNAYDQIRADLGPEEPLAAPLAPQAAAAPLVATPAAAANGDRESVHVTVSESISAKLSREGTVESFDVTGNLQLRISDPSMTQIKLNLNTDDSRPVQWTTHPKVDKQVWQSGKVVQLKDTSRGFPSKGAPLEVLRWKHADKSGSAELPITLTAWVNEGDAGTYSITVEYELAVGESLRDVTVTIPFSQSEPTVSSFDEVYQVTGDSIDWNIGTVDSSKSSGSFEFEAAATEDSAFFPMKVSFAKTTPLIDVDVSAGSSLWRTTVVLTLPSGLVGVAAEHEPRCALFARGQIISGQVHAGVRLVDDNAEHERIRGPNGIRAVTAPARPHIGEVPNPQTMARPYVYPDFCHLCTDLPKQ